MSVLTCSMSEFSEGNAAFQLGNICLEHGYVGLKDRYVLLNSFQAHGHTEELLGQQGTQQESLRTRVRLKLGDDAGDQRFRVNLWFGSHRLILSLDARWRGPSASQILNLHRLHRVGQLESEHP